MQRLLKNVLTLAVLGTLALAQATTGKPATASSTQKETVEKYHGKHKGKLKERQKSFGPNDKMAAAGSACDIVNKDKKGQICAYDIEQIPNLPPDHPALYISVSQGESILWYSSAAHKFHIQQLRRLTEDCPAQPFKHAFYDSTGTPTDSSVASDVAHASAIGCEYKMRVRVKLDDGKIKAWDPHIIIGQ